jgi:hypothetical protein
VVFVVMGISVLVRRRQDARQRLFYVETECGGDMC